MADALYSIQVEGLRELLARADVADKQTKRLVREGLRDAVKPVRDEADRLFTKYDPRSAHAYRVVVRKTGVVSVEQRLGRTTGQHPEFTRLQINKALVPGYQFKRPQVIANLQRTLDEIQHIFPGVM